MDARSADSRPTQTAAAETLFRLSGLTPLPMSDAIEYVDKVIHHMSVARTAPGSICFVCRKIVSVDCDAIIPFEKSGVCSFCCETLLEEETAGDVEGFKCLSAEGTTATRLMLLLLEYIREADHWEQPCGLTTQQYSFVRRFLDQIVDDVQVFFRSADMVTLR